MIAFGWLLKCFFYAQRRIRGLEMAFLPRSSWRQIRSGQLDSEEDQTVLYTDYSASPFFSSLRHISLPQEMSYPQHIRPSILSGCPHLAPQTNPDTAMLRRLTHPKHNTPRQLHRGEHVRLWKAIKVAAPATWGGSLLSLWLRWQAPTLNVMWMAELGFMKYSFSDRGKVGAGYA